MLIYQVINWSNSLYLHSSLFNWMNSSQERGWGMHRGRTGHRTVSGTCFEGRVLSGQFCCSWNCSLIPHSVLSHSKHPSLLPATWRTQYHCSFLSITVVSCTQSTSQITHTLLKLPFQENTRKTASPVWTSFFSICSYKALSNSTPQTSVVSKKI